MGWLWTVYCRDVCVNFIRFMVVFSLGYFGGGWFLIHIQRVIKSGLPFRTVPATHGYSNEWIWICPYSCECGNGCVLVRVGTTTWWPDKGKIISGACAPHALWDHLPILRRGLNVSFDSGTEGGIFSYFSSLVFPAYFKVVRRCNFWNLFPSLWQKWWCKCGIAIDDVSGDLNGGPWSVLVRHWWWNLYVLVPLYPDLRVWVVSHRQSRS